MTVLTSPQATAPVAADTLFLGSFPLTPTRLSVAKENFTASKPPIRSLNVTDEILSMLRLQEVKTTLASRLTKD